MNNLLAISLIGIGATATMDLWNLVRKFLFGMTPPNYAMVGRWLAYMPQGRFRHTAISTSAPIRGEHFIGWTAHYATGMAFAAVLVAFAGEPWIYHPTLGPALAVGVATVAAPFLLMQPGMGAGIAARRTPKPNVARVHSLINHGVFGLGLFATGWLLQLCYSM
ncbi:DUF2938 domain-containing protein [Gilvimarinus xylanilyticus]|uniref:DUF2938 domain-containing protein n=1 Tax=Gilvimarinus xylanilyticus TaxID=2944139 RepID=A0A9X2I613_9GAMM|nr:DUF2938 domain-containing protein [Gilvimarinus xylanilyticus]MCP8899537.1 DUF2938 domain-containing protein [Gilvimarinus xylanilyticus]